MWIVRLALRRPLSVAALLIMILGAVSFVRTNIDIFPTIDLPVAILVWSYPGMYAHVAIQIAGHAGAPQVPDDALIFRKGKVYVPIVEAGHLRLIEVSLGYDNGQTVEITRGLSGGEMVALNVGQTAHDGEPVRPHRLDQSQR
jgi:hypothetical protein